MISTSNLRALVLNADMRPVTSFPLSTWGVERSAKNEFLGRVNVLERHDVELRSAHRTYRPPSVVQLISYVRQPQAVPFTRLNLFLRDDFTCQYCGERFESADLTFDHVIPRSQGGPSNFENIVAACGPCNSRKGDSRAMVPMRPPRAPRPQDLILRPEVKRLLHASWFDYLYWSGVLEKD